MDFEDISLAEEQPIAHLLVEEVPNSQTSQNKELEYNPFVSQDLSQAGPSKYLTPSTVQSQKETTEFRKASVPVKKRRGRPSRHSKLHLKPTRESVRQRKCTAVLNYQSFQDKSWQWSERDKQLFLQGCLKVGIQDIEGLKKFLPHKSEYEIRSQIGMWKELASKNVEKQLSCDGKNQKSAKITSLKNLDEWIDYFKEKTKTSNASTFVISNIFSFIAEYGTFPPPEECGGVDARAMYRYIHCMMNGLPPHGLNEVTATVMLRSIDKVLEKINDPNFIESMEEHLFNIPQKSEKFNEKYGKTYSQEMMNPSKGIDQILKSPILNPLNQEKSALFSELLRDCDSDNQEDDDEYSDVDDWEEECEDDDDDDDDDDD